MARLRHPETGAPFAVAATSTVGTSGRFELREDLLRFVDGADALYTVVGNPDSALVVPYFDGGDTVLVRQWRHAWNASSWEVPAGTLESGEDPLQCARRELAEEAGLVATRYTPLGAVHGAAVMTGCGHLFLAEGLTETERAPERYEQDMQVLRLPFTEALDAALEGHIVHSGSVTALCRAARVLKLL